LSLLPPPGYSPLAAAELLGVSLRTLRRAIDRGEVTAVPFPHRKLIPAAEVERLAAKGLRQRAPGAGGGPRR